jgi:hypothetical protein
MLAAARSLARGNAALAALVERAAGGGQPRGRLDGPGAVRLRVDPRGNVTLFGQETVFRGGELAEVRLSGNGDSDIDLFVLDENGIEVCRSTSRTDHEFCIWRPRWTGRFRIHVVNRGPVPNIFNLVTN